MILGLRGRFGPDPPASVPIVDRVAGKVNGGRPHCKSAVERKADSNPPLAVGPPVIRGSSPRVGPVTMHGAKMSRFGTKSRPRFDHDLSDLYCSPRMRIGALGQVPTSATTCGAASKCRTAVSPDAESGGVYGDGVKRCLRTAI